MPSQDKDAFRQIWPRCFIIFMGIVEVLAVIVFVLTELGNIASNFWITNVFAGAWCGLMVLVHFFALFVAGCCSPTPSAAFRAVVVTVITLIACALLISFNAVFIAQPTTCILTSSCNSNAVSTTMFSYTMQQNFFTLFNTLGPFKSYTQTQAKFLFQTIQLGVGSLCFVLCLIYLVIYFVTKSKASKRVAPKQQRVDYQAPQPAYQQQQRQTFQQPGPGSRQPPRAPQPAPGEVQWNPSKQRY